MWLMLQQEAPRDYVIATGIGHSIREFCQRAFERVGLDYREYVIFDQKFYRPVEEVPLIGDATRASKELDWHPSIQFPELVQLMVDEDMAQVEDGQGN